MLTTTPSSYPMRKVRRVALLCAVFSGCATTQTPSHMPNTRLADDAEKPITLGLDDVFDMRIYGEPALSQTYRVGSDGAVSLPLIGRMQLGGLTPAEAGLAIAQQLGRYIRQPHVSLFMREYNSKKVYVLGEVRNPGTFVYTTGMNIVQAVTLAGGFERLADKDGAYVTRNADNQEQRVRVSLKDIGEGRASNFALQPGDIVYIPEAMF